MQQYSPSASSPAQPSKPRWRLSAGVWLYVAAMLLVVWAAVLAMLAAQRSDALEAETRQASNLARALAEQTLRVLAASDQALQRLGDERLSGRMRPEDLIRFANETGLTPKILVQLSLIDAQGRFVGSNLDPEGRRTGHVDLSQREHVSVHLKSGSGLGRERLFVGKPVLGKVSGLWTIQLSRAIADDRGTIQGVGVASLDPSYFEEVYKRVELGTTGSITLVGSDLSVRARVVGGEGKGLGTMLPADSPFVPQLQRSEGSYRSMSSLDGVTRSYAFKRVAPEYPLFVVVGSGEDEALAGWRVSRNVTLALTALLSAAVVAAATIFVRGLRRLEQSNEALRASEAEALAASQAKSEFLAAVSHELRTPLTSIRGFAELMEKRLPDERYRESAGLIRKGAEHLNHLLTEILDLAKVEAGAMVLNAEPVELRPLLQGTVDFFVMSANAKGLQLVSEIDPALPSHIVCDGLRLKQILNNLLSNAIKFTEQGAVRLRLGRDGEQLLLQVIDTGPGIPVEKQALIFEKFRQGDARVSTQHGGTGLGLALSKALAELMHGTLTVQSQPGEGSTFTLRMPLARR